MRLAPLAPFELKAKAIGLVRAQCEFELRSICLRGLCGPSGLRLELLRMLWVTQQVLD